MNLRKLKVPILLLLLFSTAFIWGNAALGDPMPAPEYAQITEKIISDLSFALRVRGWRIKTSGNSVYACRLEGAYAERVITLSLEPDGRGSRCRVSLADRGEVISREFVFTTGDPEDIRNLERLVLPFVFESISKGNDSDATGVYEAEVLLGSSVFYDGAIAPLRMDGTGILFGFSLVYDPMDKCRLSTMPVSIGDYFSTKVSCAFDPDIRDINYNINVLIYGWNSYRGDGAAGTRLLAGIFVGLEFFRPDLDLSSISWYDNIYHTHPYLQLIMLRPLTLGVRGRRHTKRTVFTAMFQVGGGFTINSSLAATNLDPDEVESLSPIFRSKEYGGARSQNFYYGASIPASLSLRMDHASGLRSEISWNLYPCMPIEHENARDIINIAGIMIGYYLHKNVLINLKYEYWRIDSMLEDRHKNHSWNRWMFYLAYEL